MAKDLTPRGKISRKYGENLFGLPKYDKIVQKRPYEPGQHGASGKRKRVSEYGLQLKEKQKAKYIYGLLEKQFKIIYEKAKSDKGITGENLMVRLECRLDTLVHRLGFAPSQRAARQMVSHKHFMVNGRSANIPSMLIRVNDVISVKEKSKKLEIIHESLKNVNENPRPYLKIDKAVMEGTLTDLPKREDIPVKINEQLIVELYSK
ncbi:MAG: 30S ribosomal protein S4 [Candidatus Delongbacteria bacterium]|jgi:small subunit ribosomal protein S4|nr:30S ribosomal protein S4 [Candidatus Delongbacteria bacterium]MDD4204527.1 30S ribosomal protein S4 [Candidatus Delongbacteria bacterium]MDY0017465.1 30S ribosomal protein S4 [Candidatus Delongbacteria bacterium]